MTARQHTCHVCAGCGSRLPARTKRTAIYCGAAACQTLARRNRRSEKVEQPAHAKRWAHEVEPVERPLCQCLTPIKRAGAAYCSTAACQRLAARDRMRLRRAKGASEAARVLPW